MSEARRRKGAGCYRRGVTVLAALVMIAVGAAGAIAVPDEFVSDESAYMEDVAIESTDSTITDGYQDVPAPLYDEPELYPPYETEALPAPPLDDYQSCDNLGANGEVSVEDYQSGEPFVPLESCPYEDERLFFGAFEGIVRHRYFTWDIEKTVTHYRTYGAEWRPVQDATPTVTTAPGRDVYFRYRLEVRAPVSYLPMADATWAVTFHNWAPVERHIDFTSGEFTVLIDGQIAVPDYDAVVIPAMSSGTHGRAQVPFRAQVPIERIVVRDDQPTRLVDPIPIGIQVAPGAPNWMDGQHITSLEMSWVPPATTSGILGTVRDTFPEFGPGVTLSGNRPELSAAWDESVGAWVWIYEAARGASIAAGGYQAFENVATVTWRTDLVGDINVRSAAATVVVRSEQTPGPGYGYGASPYEPAPTPAAPTVPGQPPLPVTGAQLHELASVAVMLIGVGILLTLAGIRFARTRPAESHQVRSSR